MPDKLPTPDDGSGSSVRALIYSIRVYCPSHKCSFSSTWKNILIGGIEDFMTRCLRTHKRLHPVCEAPRLRIDGNFEETQRAATPGPRKKE